MDSWIRYVHVVINIIFMATGILLIGFGLYIRFASGTQELIAHVNGNIAIIFGSIAIGFVIFVIGACGSVGFCYKSKPLLFLYLCADVLFLMAEIGVIVFIVLERDSFNSHLKPIWNGLDNNTKNLLQDRFNCCGYASPNEWGNNYPRSCINDTVPRKVTNIWQTTCFDAIISFLEDNLIIGVVIVGTIFLLQVLEVVIVCFLICEVKDRERAARRFAIR